MGKTDPFIFGVYKQIIDNVSPNFKNVCLLGFSKHNAFTSQIKSENFDFFDLSLENWDINNQEWLISEKYDLIVCTRCAYFCKDVDSFFSNCYNILKEDGVLLVDWGLGDHWRYQNYKIGWVKNGEHESFYKDDNYLWSTIWHDEFESHPNYKKFEDWVEKFGYKNVKESIFRETPVVYQIENQFSKFKTSIFIQTFWEDSPQIYFIFCGRKNKK